VEAKLRAGMARQGIEGEAAEQIVHAITAFALYGFPESHASSFALLAYASAYLKAHHPPAFYAALLNNQPMGFYHPATIVKDAQRHGQRILPVDVTRSDWLCTVEPSAPGMMSPRDAREARPGESLAVRLGLRYVRGLRETAAKALVAARAERPSCRRSTWRTAARPTGPSARPGVHRRLLPLGHAPTEHVAMA
jgi:error-prone DNA polymerase